MSEELVVQKYQITPWEQMKEEAQAIGASGLFPHIDTMAKAMAIALLGRDLGLSVSQAIYGINVIKGRPSLSANIMQQLILRHHGGKALYYKESTKTSCTLEYRRKDADRGGEYTYTIEDAKLAGLTSKDVWQKDPAAMLRARTLSIVARMVFADAIGGSYLSDEVEDVPLNARTMVAPEVSPVRQSNQNVSPPGPVLATPPSPANPLEGHQEPETAEFTVMNEHGQDVNTETGEVQTPTVTPMSDMQRTKLRTMQAELGYSLEVEEVSYETAAQRITILCAERDKREAAKAAPKKRRTSAEVAAEKAAKAQPTPNMEEQDEANTKLTADMADIGKEMATEEKEHQTAVERLIWGQVVPDSLPEVGVKLVKARQFLADILGGFPVYLSPTQLTDDFEGEARRQRLLHLYNALIAGRGEGMLDQTHIEHIGNALYDLRGHRSIPPIVSMQSAKAFVSELLEENKYKKQAADLAEFEAMPT